jgi:hypothetical protein
MISRQQRPENLAKESGAIKLVLSIFLDVLSFAEVGDNYPWLSKRTHEHLDH